MRALRGRYSRRELLRWASGGLAATGTFLIANSMSGAESALPARDALTDLAGVAPAAGLGIDPGEVDFDQAPLALLPSWYDDVQTFRRTGTLAPATPPTATLAAASLAGRQPWSDNLEDRPAGVADTSGLPAANISTLRSSFAKLPATTAAIVPIAQPGSPNAGVWAPNADIGPSAQLPPGLKVSSVGGPATPGAQEATADATAPVATPGGMAEAQAGPAVEVPRIGAWASGLRPLVGGPGDAYPWLPETDRVVIPSIDIDARVLTVGVTKDLYMDTPGYAAGRFVASAQAGGVGNVVLSAHNDILGGVFRALPETSLGAMVYLHRGPAQFTYQVRYQTKVWEEGAPPELRRENARFLRPTKNPVCTLITCVPLWVDTHRWIVRAVLVDVQVPQAPRQATSFFGNR